MVTRDIPSDPWSLIFDAESNPDRVLQRIPEAAWLAEQFEACDNILRALQPYTESVDIRNMRIQLRDVRDRTLQTYRQLCDGEDVHEECSG